jgi:replicative DNA helicase
MTTHARTRQRPQERSSAAFGDLSDRLTNVDAERQYLAGVLDLMDRDERQARELVSMVAVPMFTDADCRQVAAATADLATGDTWPARGDVIRWLRQKRQSERLDVATDPARALVLRLAADELLTGRRATELAREAADEIANLYLRRQAADLAADVAERLRRGDASADVLADVTRQLEAAADHDNLNKPITFLDCCDQWAEADGGLVVPTGLRPFDEATEGGLPVGGVTALIAPPKAGKSAMALQLALGALVQDRELRAVYGLGEMSPAALARRAACVGSYLLDGEPVTTRQAKRRTSAARNSLAELTAVVGDRLTVVKPPLTVASMTAAVTKTDARLLVVDYLQLVRGDGDSKVEQLDRIVDELQLLATSRNVAILMISSMAKGTAGKLAAHEWGRGTGQIGYAAELIYVARPDEETDEHGLRSFRWECAAARNLAATDVDLRFDGAVQTFLPAEQPDTAFDAFAAEVPV